MPTKPRKKPAPAPPDPRKVSISLPGDVLAEMAREARRQDRSLSGIAQMAWKLAREKIHGYGPAPLSV